MPRSSPRVHLIDGSVYIFRAYYSLPPLPAPDGTPVGAAYGFVNTLLKYLTDTQATHVGVAFDSAAKTFRNDIEPDYKAQREETPEDLDPQFRICVEACQALGVADFEQQNFEADDVIGTLTRKLLAKGARVRVVSSDKDLTRLVREDGRVSCFDLARNIELDAKGVRAKFGVSPSQIPDYLGLAGDAVDNLPGVPGIGSKGAAATLRFFGCIEDVPDDVGAWPPAARRLRGAKRLASLIREHRDRALLTRELATLRYDVPNTSADLRRLAYRGAFVDSTREFFDRLGWERIATRVPRWRSGSS